MINKIIYLILISILIIPLVFSVIPLQGGSQSLCNNNEICDENENQDNCPNDCLNNEQETNTNYENNNLQPGKKGYSISSIIIRKETKLPTKYIIYTFFIIILLILFIFIYKYEKTHYKKQAKLLNKKITIQQKDLLPQKPKRKW